MVELSSIITGDVPHFLMRYKMSVNINFGFSEIDSEYVNPFIAGNYENLLKVERDHIESIYTNIKTLSPLALNGHRCVMSDAESRHFESLNYQQQVNVVLAFFGGMGYIALVLDMNEEEYMKACKKKNNYQWSFPEIFFVGIASKGYFCPISMLENTPFRIK
jgi:hypothetical protein